MEETFEYDGEAKSASTRIVLLEALAKLGGFTSVKPDGSIRAFYQGTSIDIIISNYFVRIYDRYWRTLTPEEQEPYLLETVNGANYGPFATLIVAKDEELVFLHTKINFIFPPGIAYPEEYLQAHLKQIFQIRERLDARLQAMRSKNRE